MTDDWRPRFTEEQRNRLRELKESDKISDVAMMDKLLKNMEEHQ